ncbi:SDR family oxidoreductase [Tropicimonas sp. IMCC6043]|nr:SDR family oxidoreductase [Tropicimonas sp. IMCC6043]
MTDLSGKSVWVTGASSGIGEAIAEAFCAAGARVAISARRADALRRVQEAFSTLRGEVASFPLDVSEAEAVAEAAKHIRANWGGIDILVNCAGINVKKRHWRDLDIADWHRMIAINLNGVANTVTAALPLMRAQKDGLIVNISSWAAQHEFAVAGPAYIASKRGVIELSHSINREEMQHNIRCCCICPAEVATPILEQRPVPVSEEDAERMLQPADLAELVTFVAAAPSRVCFNEIVISPTYNRTLLPQP